MAKTLGSYIRFIPKADQETMVAVLRYKRNEMHRGMLAFIPIDEIMWTLRDAQQIWANWSTAQYLAQQQAQHNQSYQNPFGNPFWPGAQSGLGSGLGQGIG